MSSMTNFLLTNATNSRTMLTQRAPLTLLRRSREAARCKIQETLSSYTRRCNVARCLSAMPIVEHVSLVVGNRSRHNEGGARRNFATHSFFSSYAMPAEASDADIAIDDALKTRLDAFTIKERAKQLRVLLLSNSFNSMTQRAYLELKETYDQDVRIEIAINEEQMVDCVRRHDPHLILCPFLTKRIPEEIWKDESRLCLVVHPGIHGDRGASSIDWALQEQSEEWGVTVLQADEEMDAGDIWATRNFDVPSGATKSNLYGSVVVDTAMAAIHEAMTKIVTGRKGIPLDYSDANVKGTLRPNMKLGDRSVDFSQPAQAVANQIRFSDSSPGAPHTFVSADGEAHKVFLYNAQVDKTQNIKECIEPGTITGRRNGAVRIACGLSGESIWISHMKGRGKDTLLPRIKLPSCDILPQSILEEVPDISSPKFFFPESLPSQTTSSNAECLDLWCDLPQDAPGVAVLHFPFLNGAMSTEQCQRVTELLRETSQREDVKVIVLAGGASAWSNGINLNTVEASQDPAAESWANINAINDFVKQIYSITDKTTVAALQGNAGAGGIMAALACDLVWSHKNVVVNPHYKSMGLHGSEYWTYFLPQRVGQKTAHKLTEQCLPVSAQSANKIGMIDEIISSDRESFMEGVMNRSKMLTRNEDVLSSFCASKSIERNQDWHYMMDQVRARELRIMRENFSSSQYETARHNFVFKKSSTATPLHLSIQHLHNNRTGEQVLEGGDDRNASCSSQATPAVAMNGIRLAKTCNSALTRKVQALKEEYDGASPSLAVLLVHGDADSERYVARKVKTAAKVDIETTVYGFDRNESSSKNLEEELIKTIQELNQDPAVNGIMVQLPLPSTVNKHRVLGTVCPSKDVDGFSASNLGAIFGGSTSTESNSHPCMIPCTAKGIVKLLDHYNVPLTGKKVCIIGRSCIVGLPTQLCVMKRGATVTNCDCNTSPQDLAENIGQADIVVAAAGSPELVKASWIKPGAVVVDVGFHVRHDEQGKEYIVGDVEAEAASVASLITPVPGGVGPMTVACLLENTVEAFEHQQFEKRQSRNQRMA